MFIDLHSWSKTELKFFSNHAQGTALFVFLASVLFCLSACSLPSANKAPAGLQVQVRVPAIASQTADAVQGSEVSSLDLVGVDFGLIMVDDLDLSSDTALGTRFSKDIGSLDATEPESAIGAQYLTSTLSWEPGQNASVQFDNLNPGARYAIVLYAELEIEDPPGVFSTEERYGYTRVSTKAGETTAALVNLDSNYDNLSDQIFNWYGIALPVKDSVSVSVTPLTVSATEGGADGTYDVVLTTQPTADVNIALASGGEVTPTPTALTFTTANWDTPQTVTVTAVDDAVGEGPHNEIITHAATSGDAAYNGIAISDVTVDITDNDMPGVSVTPLTVSATEGGVDGTYQVVLTTPPTGDVDIALASGGEATPTPTALTFTTVNWNTAQTVTVSAVDDAVAEGAHNDTITHAATSVDGDYNGITISDVSVDITDNDAPGVSVTPLTVSATEGGADGTYQVVLTTQPTADVNIALASGGEATPTPTALTFTTLDWNTAQTVTVAAVDDAVAEGVHNDTITHTATSGDAGYNGITISDVTVDITDNDPVTVTYDANTADYGSAPIDANSYTVGDTVTTLVNSDGLVKNGAVFAGWNTADDGSGTSYAAGGPFTITGDTTLYAEWDTSNGGFAGGDGSPGAPYQIQTPEHLNNVRTNLGVNYELIADVDLNVPPWNTAPGWDPIGGGIFSGTLNGNGFVIQNLFRDAGGTFALFDTVENATIEDLGLENVSIQNGNTVAALAVNLNGTSLISRVYATGILSTFADGGGLVAVMNNGTIEESYTNVDITVDTADGGGIAARMNNGTIRNAYTMGPVRMDFNSSGGFVGETTADTITIENSFSIGVITNVGRGFVGIDSSPGITALNNFYDTDTSTTSDPLNDTRATPETTANMQLSSTFGAWDIGGIWDIVDGSSYPYLNWQDAGTGTRP